MRANAIAGPEKSKVQAFLEKVCSGFSSGNAQKKNSSLAEHENQPRDGNGKPAPERRALQSEPSKKDEGRAEKRNEQPVTARRIKAEHAAPRRPAGIPAFP